MKNIQVIDGANNCTYSIFQATEEEFSLIFPDDGQEVQFSEDLGGLKNKKSIDAALNNIWDRPVKWRDAQGIHGLLFYELSKNKKYYNTLREGGMDASAYNHAQRKLFGLV